MCIRDSYLTYHYTGRAFQDNAGSLSIPDRTETIVAPGLGAIGLSALGVSADTVSPGETILMLSLIHISEPTRPY